MPKTLFKDISSSVWLSIRQVVYARPTLTRVQSVFGLKTQDPDVVEDIGCDMNSTPALAILSRRKCSSSNAGCPASRGLGSPGVSP